MLQHTLLVAEALFTKKLDIYCLNKSFISKIVIYSDSNKFLLYNDKYINKII